MENTKRRRGRPPKCKVMEFAGMTYEGAINNALDKRSKPTLTKALPTRTSASSPMMNASI